MIDCTRCGNDSRDDDMFCAACGAYLDWFGQPVVREEPEPEPVVEPQVLSSASPSVALVPRIRTVVGRPGTRPPEARRQGLRAGGDAPEPVVVPDPPAVRTPVASAPEPRLVVRSVRAPLVAVAPGRVKMAPPRRRVIPQEEVLTGGPSCPDCRAANGPDRKFCRKCGAWLEQIVVEIVPPPPPWPQRWWQRIRNRLRRRPPPTARAGERPYRRARGAWLRTLGRVLLCLLGVAVLVAAFVPGFRQGIRATTNGAFGTVQGWLTRSYVPVHPVRATATSALPDHGPDLAGDSLTDTYWAEQAAGDGNGQGLQFVFDEPVDLDRMIIRIGASGSEDAFLSQPRPRVLHVVFADGTSDDLALKDVATPQKLKIKAKQIAEVQFTITSVYRSPSGHDASISEIEFFARS